MSTRVRGFVSSQHSRRMHASIGPSPVKRRTRVARHNTRPANTAGGIERAMPRGPTSHGVHALLTSRRRRAAGSWTRRRRGWRPAHTGRTRKIRSAKNFLRDHHEFFVVANITARKFGWARVFPAAIGPRVCTTDWSRAQAPPPDGGTWSHGTVGACRYACETSGESVSTFMIFFTSAARMDFKVTRKLISFPFWG